MLETYRGSDSQRTKAEEEPFRYIKGPKPALVFQEILAVSPVAYESLQQSCAAIGIENVRPTVRKLSVLGLVETIKAGNKLFIDVTPDGYSAAYVTGLLDINADETAVQPVETLHYLQHQPKPERAGIFRLAHGGKIRPRQDDSTRGAEKMTKKRAYRYYLPETTVTSFKRKQDTKSGKRQVEEGLDEVKDVRQQSYDIMNAAYSIAAGLEEAEISRTIYVRTFPINSQPPSIADLDGKINQLQRPS